MHHESPLVLINLGFWHRLIQNFFGPSTTKWVLTLQLCRLLRSYTIPTFVKAGNGLFGLPPTVVAKSAHTKPPFFLPTSWIPHRLAEAGTSPLSNDSTNGGLVNICWGAVLKCIIVLCCSSPHTLFTPLARDLFLFLGALSVGGAASDGYGLLPFSTGNWWWAWWMGEFHQFHTKWARSATHNNLPCPDRKGCEGRCACHDYIRPHQRGGWERPSWSTQFLRASYTYVQKVWLDNFYHIIILVCV